MNTDPRIGTDQEIEFFALSMNAFKELKSDAQNRVLAYYKLIYEHQLEKKDA